MSSVANGPNDGKSSKDTSASASSPTPANPGSEKSRSSWELLRGTNRTADGVSMVTSPDVQGQTTDVRSGALTVVAILVITAMTLSVLFPLVPWSVKLVVMAVVFLSLRYWGGILVLAFVQLDLMSREGRIMNVLSGPDGFLLAFCIAAVLKFIARQRDLLNEVTRSDFRTLLRRLFTDDPRTQTAPPPGVDSESGSFDGTLRVLASALRGLLVLLLCATMARYALAVMPRGRVFSLRIRDYIVENPELTGVSLLLVGLIAMVLVLTEIGWRQMTSSQGRMYLRAALLKQMYRDLRMVTMRRLRMRQKRHGPASDAGK